MQGSGRGAVITDLEGSEVICAGQGSDQGSSHGRSVGDQFIWVPDQSGPQLCLMTRSLEQPGLANRLPLHLALLHIMIINI